MYESCSQQGLRHTFLLSDVSEAQRGRHKSLHILVEIPLWALQAKLLPCSNSLIKQSCLRRISTALSWRSFLVLSSCPRQADTTHPHPHPKRSIPCLCLPIAPLLLLWKLHSSQMQIQLFICLPCHAPENVAPLHLPSDSNTENKFHRPPHINQVPQLTVVWTLIPNVLPQMPMRYEIFSLPSPMVDPNTFLPEASPTPYTAVNTTLPRTSRRGGNSKFSSFMRESRSSLKLELRSWFPYQSSGTCWVKVCLTALVSLLWSSANITLVQVWSVILRIIQQRLGIILWYWLSNEVPCRRVRASW